MRKSSIFVWPAPAWGLDRLDCKSEQRSIEVKTQICQLFALNNLPRSSHIDFICFVHKRLLEWFLTSRCRIGRVKKPVLSKIKVHMMFSHDVYIYKLTQKVSGPQSSILLWDLKSIKVILKGKWWKNLFSFFAFPFSNNDKNSSIFETLGSSSLIWYPYCYTL